MNAQKSLSYDDFYFLRYLGKGTFGKVALVRLKTNNKLYALKILKKEDINVKSTVENIMNEKNIMMKNTHPFIVKLR